MSAIAPTHTPSSSRLDRPWFGGLETLRFGAALAVLLHHAAFATGATYRWGEDGDVAGQLLGRLDVGVTVFFVLSGFVLYRPFVDAQFRGGPGPATVPFWIRRAARIYPAYWAALWIQLLLGTVVVSGLAGLALTTGLLHTFFVETVLDGMSQSWTLATEIGFYLLLPLFARLGRRWTARPDRTVAQQATALLGFCAVVVLSSFVFRAAVVVAFPRAESSISNIARLWTPAHLDAFGAGMALAVLSAWAVHQPFVGRSLARLARPLWAWWAGALAVFWFVSTQFGLGFGLDVDTFERDALRQSLYVVVGVALIVPAVFDRSPTAAAPGPGGSAWLERPALVWLGSLAYGVYLWHLAVIDWASGWFGWATLDGDFFVLVAVAVPGSMLLAVASRFLVEDPVMRAVRRRQGRPRRPVTRAGSAS